MFFEALIWIRDHWKVIGLAYLVQMLAAWAFVYGAGKASGR